MERMKLTFIDSDLLYTDVRYCSCMCSSHFLGVAYNKDYRCKYSVNTQKTTLSVPKSVYLSFRATNVISKIIYNEDSIIFCKC